MPDYKKVTIISKTKNQVVCHSILKHITLCYTNYKFKAPKV